MKMHEHHCSIFWGVLVALFGVFFLIANFTHVEMLKYWPIFLILAGSYKAITGCCCPHHRNHK